jgi:hypothetical protein
VLLLSRVIPWLPLGAVSLHLIEEFVWPGGFADWYRRYRPERARSVTTSFLFWINALFLAMAVIAGTLGSRPQGVAFWLVVASIGAANGLFHAWASYRSRTYSPGVGTGLVLYIPLAVFGFVSFGGSGRASTGTMVQALLIGPAYHLYAAWNHRRRARRLGLSGPRVT